MQRAEEFFKSQRFLDLVKKAGNWGVFIEAKELSTTIRYNVNSEYVHTTEWSWNTQDCEDFIFTFLQKHVEMLLKKE